MEEKYLKDFVIALVVISLILLIVKDMSLYSKTGNVPMESKYKELALGEELLQNIHNLENSIKERKDFVFSVTKDPLEQNLIVKTIQDLEMQWREEVENMVRLESTIVPEDGKKKAVISYQGITNIYEVGDTFKKGKITDIRAGEISYNANGKTLTMQIQKLPEKPASIKKSGTNNKNREYNW
ncbi:MAG: hypothetical protein K9N09_08600 [Candidatus Cloacimonetes bacterium]|nr:hypothetical protein [Candidatus Cloacimonadota bacterium]MCF7814157.1 hypothetical protein [Candidatus Cloacimonadota bacterium]MCF7868744.1 hypothetical protein [Candidatus Cloacimonadota bacterium]MCF7884156.1 hypothetical protein [Candidatus Cloacimonadota bacterium]